MKKTFQGIMPAIVSPCDVNDNFQEDSFFRLATHLLEQGVHGLYVCGCTGNGYSMRLDERKRAAELAVEAAKPHNAKIIVHVGTLHTRDAVELAQHAGKIHADAISSIPPMNLGYSEIYSYYSDLVQSSGIPLIIYHVPVISHVSLSLKQLCSLLDIDGIIGLKYTDWNLYFMKTIRMARPETTIFCGFDEVISLGLLYGADGGIGSHYNIFPQNGLGIYNAVKRNDLSRALQLQNALNDYITFYHQNQEDPLFEYLLRREGYGPYVWRRPRLPLDEKQLNHVMSELEHVIEKNRRILTPNDLKV